MTAPAEGPWLGRFSRLAGVTATDECGARHSYCLVPCSARSADDASATSRDVESATGGWAPTPPVGSARVIAFLPSDGPSFVNRWRPIKIAGAASR
jgi:hypothetical protein